MAKINKLQKSGVTIYPATIPQAVIDSETGKTQKEVNDEVKVIQDGVLTVTNLAVNGDFRNGMTGWTPIAPTRDKLTLTARGLKIEFLGNASNNLGAYVPNTNFNAKSGERLYVRYTGEFQRAGGSLFWRINTTHTINTISNPANGVSSTIYTLTVDLQTFYLSLTGGTPSVSDYLLIENFQIINLTQAFGAGNEPTKTEMDELIKVLPNGYFEGTLQNKYLHIWQLNLIRQNRNAIVALGGTII